MIGAFLGEFLFPCFQVRQALRLELFLRRERCWVYLECQSLLVEDFTLLLRGFRWKLVGVMDLAVRIDPFI